MEHRALANVVLIGEQFRVYIHANWTSQCGFWDDEERHKCHFLFLPAKSVFYIFEVPKSVF
jgi:hypothetical protein